MLSLSNALADAAAAPVYTWQEIIFLFVLIPLGVIALVVLAVYAPSWARSSHGDGDQADRADAAPVSDVVRLSSPSGSMHAPSGPGIQTPTGPTVHTEPGGSSAQW